MTRHLIYIAILMILHLECNGQNFFNFTDINFEVGQIKRIQISFEFSGGCHPSIESLPMLDSICDFLKRNKNLKIEIGTHTDYRGDSIMNIKLSELRASRVKDYLINKGIENERIEYKGYGEFEPIIVDKKISDCYQFLDNGQRLTADYIKKLDTFEKQEIANMLNRRTELKILKINWP